MLDDYYIENLNQYWIPISKMNEQIMAEIFTTLRINRTLCLKNEWKNNEEYWVVKNY